MLTKTKAYVAADGRMFTDKAEATRHGYRLKLNDVAEALVNEAGGDSGNVAYVARYLEQNATEIIKLLTKITAKPKAEASEIEPGVATEDLSESGGA